MTDNSSWQTTAAAVAGIVTAFIAMVVNPWTDSDPTTVPQWGAFASIAVTALIGFFARDHKVSDEQAGAGRK